MHRNVPARVGRLLLPVALGLAAACANPGNSTRTPYRILLPSAEGLKAGSGVHLRGVPVGTVRTLRLSPDPDRLEVEVGIEVDSQAALWIREGTLARIRSVGLSGERFVDLLPGAATGSPLPAGSAIPAAAQLDVEELVASGEDLVANLVTISSQLAAILGRLERGEGLLGALTSDSGPGGTLAERLASALDSIDSVARRVEHGEGILARLLNDAALSASLEQSARRLEQTLALAAEGPGTLPALLRDEQLRDRLSRTVGLLESSGRRLDALLARLERGEGLLGKLLADPESGDRMARELERLLEQLAIVAEKLASGEGTAGRLIDDPSVYEAVQDVVVGVRESALLRWLVRNRQKKGIRERYERERAGSQLDGPVVPRPDPAADPRREPPPDEPPAAESGIPGERREFRR